MPQLVYLSLSLFLSFHTYQALGEQTFTSCFLSILYSGSIWMLNLLLFTQIGKMSSLISSEVPYALCPSSFCPPPNGNTSSNTNNSTGSHTQIVLSVSVLLHWFSNFPFQWNLIPTPNIQNRKGEAPKVSLGHFHNGCFISLKVSPVMLRVIYCFNWALESIRNVLKARQQ